MSEVLRVAVAAPLSDADAARIMHLEPRIELMMRQDLVAPMRFPADFSGDPGFRRSASQQQEFEALLADADALYGIPDVDPALLAQVVRSNPRLVWVQTMAAGGGGQVRTAGLTAQELQRVRFTTSAGVHGEALSEFAVFGVLAGAKSLPRLRRQQDSRVWSDRWTMRQVAGMRIVVLGNGGIGRVTSNKLAALGADVTAFSRSGKAEPGQTTRVRPIDDVWSCLPTADAVVVTLPGTASTERFVDARFFDLLTQDTILVNVGRGTVIDEVALTDALMRGRIGFAALDVFATEPLLASSPLWSMSNVLVSPHTAALDAREERHIAELFADNATRFLDGRPMRNVVNTVEFY